MNQAIETKKILNQLIKRIETFTEMASKCQPERADELAEIITELRAVADLIIKLSREV